MRGGSNEAETPKWSGFTRATADSAATLAALTARGYHVNIVPLHSFNRSGGAAYCLTLRLDNTTAQAPTVLQEVKRAA